MNVFFYDLCPAMYACYLFLPGAYKRELRRLFKPPPPSGQILLNAPELKDHSYSY